MGEKIEGEKEREKGAEGGRGKRRNETRKGRKGGERKERREGRRERRGEDREKKGKAKWEKNWGKRRKAQGKRRGNLGYRHHFCTSTLVAPGEGTEIPTRAAPRPVHTSTISSVSDAL